MTQRLTQFGTMTNTTYTFPQAQQSFRDNFASAVPNTIRLPGLSGGFDLYGADAAPQEIGRVQSSFKMISTPSAMDDLRLAVNAMYGWGLQRLYMQPAKTGANPRWCYARVNNIDMAQNLDSLADWVQTVNIDFQVPDPHWYSDGTLAPTWGDGIVKWGGGFKWGGISVHATTFGTLSTLSMPINGNVATRPRLIFIVGPSTITGPVIFEHTVNGVVVDQITYSGTLTPSKTLEIDTRAQTFYVNGVEDYSTNWSYITPEIFTLNPLVLANSINIKTSDSNPAHTADFYVEYNEAYI